MLSLAAEAAGGQFPVPVDLRTEGDQVTDHLPVSGLDGRREGGCAQCVGTVGGDETRLDKLGDELGVFAVGEGVEEGGDDLLLEGVVSASEVFVFQGGQGGAGAGGVDGAPVAGGVVGVGGGGVGCQGEGEEGGEGGEVGKEGGDEGRVEWGVSWEGGVGGEAWVDDEAVEKGVEVLVLKIHGVEVLVFDSETGSPGI